MLDDVWGTVSSEFANLVLVHAQLHVITNHITLALIVFGTAYSFPPRKGIDFQGRSKQSLDIWHTRHQHVAPPTLEALIPKISEFASQ